MTLHLTGIEQPSIGTEAQRRNWLGGSEAAAALGLSPFCTSYELWLRKRGDLPLGEETEPMRWGKLLEPVVRAEYCRRTNRSVIHANALLRHPDHTWMIGHIDGEVEDNERRRILEIKTARTSFGWGDPDTDQIPFHYLLQCHHYLILSDAQVCDVAVVIGGSDYRQYEVWADPDIAAHLINGEIAFWRYVESGEPPPPNTLADVNRRWGRLNAPGAVLASEVDTKWVEELLAVRQARKDLDAREETAKTAVLRALADRGDAFVDSLGNELCSWRLDKGRKAYSVPAKDPSRRFLLYDEAA